ncbi:hypothetical protein [Nannocystis radixulma]|uniref:Uncharacterized protein n=1 Tax=Nannocystis radixulma TaxID=2995305 RepID=A0ABT5BLK5_9BACT|nr:hypothetical protein [Nannocystis radixulma]MDC0675047.1 hypothetical protein [Nannocystis radixulma]
MNDLTRRRFDRGAMHQPRALKLRCITLASLFAAPFAASAGEQSPEVAVGGCYTMTEVPPLGIPDELGQRLVALDQRGHVLLDALPGRAEDGPWSSGETARTAFVWTGDEVLPIVIDGFAQTRAVDFNEQGDVLVFGTLNPGIEPLYSFLETWWTEAAIWRDGEVLARMSVADKAESDFTNGTINERGTAALSVTDRTAALVRQGLGGTYRMRGGEIEDLGKWFLGALNDDDELFGVDPEAHEFVKWGDARTVLPTDCPDDPLDHADVQISRDGTVVATLWCGPATYFGVTWTQGAMQKLPTLGDPSGRTLTYDLNNRGEIVGSAVSAELGFESVLWRDGEIVALPVPESASVNGDEYTDINEQGLVVGVFNNKDDDNPASEYHFYVSDGELMRELPYPSPGGSDEDAAMFINDRGDIAGWMGDPLGSRHRTMLWRPCAP